MLVEDEDIHTFSCTTSVIAHICNMCFIHAWGCVWPMQGHKWHHAAPFHHSSRMEWVMGEEEEFVKVSCAGI